MHQVSPNRGKGSGKAELDSSIPEGCSGGRESALADGHELSEDDESRIAEDVDGDFHIERSSEIIPQHQPCPTPYATLLPAPSLSLPAPPTQQQSSSGSVIRWERFLPFRSLKVLLVENDDSTRHVLSALLRNCCYEVTAVANGLEAWKILEDLSNHVDIVLTEVVMPGLSGIGLLCKIINHKMSQNVPVIMMSTHDSMGLVFKCLSKGAVDFLIKPIRKNELKNLWQHVWRRCHSSSGSGSESGVQTQKSVKHRGSDESGNDSDSDQEYDDTSIDLNMQDGSDNGSGTQSSWSKQAADFENPQPVSPCNRLPEPFNSTCAQVIHPKTETFSNEWLTRTRINDHHKMEVLDQDFLCKDSEFWVPREPHDQPKSNPSENAPHNALGSQTDIYQAHLPRNNHPNNAGKETTSSNPQAAHFTGGSVNHETLTSNIEIPDSHNTLAKSKDKGISNMRGSSSLQLNMKKLTSLGESETITNDVRILLRHSDLSAFTRYNTSAASNQVPAGCLGKHSLTADTSSEVIKLRSLSKDAPLNQGTSSNNNDTGSSTQNIFVEAPVIEKPATQAALKGPHSSAFRPVQKRNPPTQEALMEKIDHCRTDTSAIIAQPSVFHHLDLDPHNNSQHHHHVHNMQQLPPLGHDEHALTNIDSNVFPQFGSSNVFAGGMEFNAANYSVNGSVSGSNHGSNALNCCSAIVNVGRINIDDDSGLAGKCGVGSGNEDRSASGSACGADQNQSRQTEAPLNRFRQKRKERCFEKKVRSQSRKKLAEQRLRVQKQFVRQLSCNRENSDS